MTQQESPSHRHMVAIAVSLLLLLIISFSVWTVVSSYHVSIRLGEEQAASYAYALSEHAERAFSEADRAILNTINTINRSGGIESLPTISLFNLARENAHDSPQIGSIVIVNSMGEMIAHSISHPMKPIDVSDRDYFRFHRDNPAGGLFISRPLKSRVVGRWRFTLSRALVDKRGNFAGLVAVAFEIEYFQKFYQNINVGKKGRIILVSSKNPVLVMQPFSEKAMTLDYSKSVLFREKLPNAPSGTFQIEKGIVLDTPARIISYNTLRDFPVIALVSMDKDEVLDIWKTGAVRHVGTTVILCIIIIILAALHLRYLHSLEDANRRLIAQKEEIRVGEEERRRVEIQLRQSQKMESIGLLAGGISHDFNNLLTPIIGYAELLRKTCNCGPEADNWIRGILESAEKSKLLTRQLLGFARKQMMEMSVLDINQVIVSFNSIIRRMIRGTIEIEVSIHDGPIHVRADRSQIEQILLNLSVNAQDAIAGHGTIRIASGLLVLDHDDERLPPELPAGRYASITVSDTGCGMDEGIRSQIFEPFFTTKSVGHGTGLGLSMVYGIVMQHEGAIRLESKPGEGTHFEILLPVVDEIPVVQTVSSSLPSTGAGETGSILVVEDNEMVRDMVVHILYAAGYRVISANGVIDAITLFSEKRCGFDLLISDIIMPGMNGTELYERIKPEHPELKVIFISGYTDDPILNEFIESANVGFLAKPFSVDDLVGKVREMLANPSPSAACT